MRFTAANIMQKSGGWNSSVGGATGSLLARSVHVNRQRRCYTRLRTACVAAKHKSGLFEPAARVHQSVAIAASRRLIAPAFLFPSGRSRSEVGQFFPHRFRRMRHQNLPSLLWLHRVCSIVFDVLVSNTIRSEEHTSELQSRVD